MTSKAWGGKKKKKNAQKKRSRKTFYEVGLNELDFKSPAQFFLLLTTGALRVDWAGEKTLDKNEVRKSVFGK